MEQKINLELTVAEASALQQLIHFAVMDKGMEVAEAAVVLNKKLTMAAQAANPNLNGGIGIPPQQPKRAEKSAN